MRGLMGPEGVCLKLVAAALAREVGSVKDRENQGQECWYEGRCQRWPSQLFVGVDVDKLDFQDGKSWRVLYIMAQNE